MIFENLGFDFGFWGALVIFRKRIWLLMGFDFGFLGALVTF